MCFFMVMTGLTYELCTAFNAGRSILNSDHFT